jgi:cobalamin biosynthesis protein CobW
MARIPATVITGFLGAGKTSLIRHLLTHAEGKRIALLINEFGDVGVDGEILKACGAPSCSQDDIIELANGCICCTVADDFLPAIEALLAREHKPDHIIVETSGLALPKPLVKAFAWPDVKAAVTVDGVVTVLDASALAAGRIADDLAALEAQRAADDTLDHESPIEELFEEQLGCADLVILNKMDLVTDQADALLAQLRPMIRAGAQILQAKGAAVDPAVVLGLEAAAEDDLESRPSHHDDGHEHDHEDFETFIVELGPLASQAALEPLRAAIADLVAAHPIYRIKGFAEVLGKPMRLTLQGVGPRLESYFDRPWQADETRATRLVVIGAHGLDQAAIAQCLQAAVLAEAAE